MFVISDWDTRIEGKEFPQKEDVSEDLESKAEILENCTSDVSLAPELGELCEDVLERAWGVPDDTSQVQSFFGEEDLAPAAVLLTSPLGERDALQ